MKFDFINQRIAAFLCFAILACNGGLLVGNDGFERAGLVNEWFTHLDVGGRSQIVNMQIQVNPNISTTYFLVEYGKSVERISEKDLDAFGKPRGIENAAGTGARQYAETRKEILLAEFAAQQRGNMEVNVRQITLPKTTIYSVTSTGQVTAIDADTGEHIWHTTVGQRRYFTGGVGASNSHVAVTNGSTVYCLSADEGRILWSSKCRRSPNAAPSVGEHSIFVPMVDGRLNVFSLEGKGGFPRSFISYGTAISKPLVTDSTVSWATDDGYYSVAPFRANTISFRLNSGDKMSAGGAAADGTIYVNTTNGSMFALDEKKGTIEWEYLTGDRLTAAPFVKGNGVFVVSAENRLYKIDRTSGLPAANWKRPLEGISQYVGSSQSRIYMLDSVGQLTAIDPESGARMATVPGANIVQSIPNRQTDRLYVATSQGSIGCYREQGNPYPVFQADEAELLAANKDVGKAAMKKEMAAGEEDPFADDSDPFAAESDPFASDDDESDPFANDSDDDDPFADDGDAEEDPFGGDDDDEDPFGGGGEDEDENDPFGGG